jgi:benzoyl-CoA reductase/2-hydroxyglutaryl-CoA dehydratase subunit BcrC/BadD/HgdB
LTVITEILDRLSGVEVLKEKLRDTGARVEQWATRVVELDRQVQDVDRRLVRIETLAEIAQAGRSAHRKLPKPE